MRIAIIGAGLGGLCAAIKLKQAGFDDFVILEKADRVGGTWRDNSYPGCACDTPVALYQFSFFPGLHWSRHYPLAHEVQAYTEALCDAFGLREHLRLGDGAACAAWDEGRARWRVETGSGATYEAAALVPALGQLNRPQTPAIPGADSFAGAAWHSARWRHDVPLAGKRVACIGSAASAVQLVPEVAKEAAYLAVYQRTPNWIIPRMDRAITDEDKALMVSDPETAMRLGAMAREFLYLEADVFFWQAFAWTPAGRAALTRRALDHLHAQAPDAALRAKLTPDYPIGCKRILICDDFYPALMRDSVELVTDGIERIVPEGIVSADGRLRAFDAIVYATGFETTGWDWSMGVFGREGESLYETWGSAPEAYLGITAAGFPNMFMLYGPNTNLGHNTITFMIERQAEYIAQALGHMREHGIAAIEPSREAQAAFNARLQADLARSVWADPACTSWYKTADGRITQNWSSHTRGYAAATKAVAWGDYALRRA